MYAQHVKSRTCLAVLRAVWKAEALQQSLRALNGALTAGVAHHKVPAHDCILGAGFLGGSIGWRPYSITNPATGCMLLSCTSMTRVHHADHHVQLLHDKSRRVT